ncbi:MULTISPECIES: HAD hydrolase family protein [unclassified Mesorhizobium]|uniref:HAD hydrolase family protein n=1 Tax=unclassified Mesorhizobium TaxID=325217 RepID=UPI001FDF90CC|nr:MULTISPECIES: HAD hydrolase family protein [unclassified Mesorhizobium]
MPAELCAAAGDAANDLPLLRWSKTRLTVANAIAPIRTIAHFCGGNCDEGGLADALDWLLQSADAHDRNGYRTR